MSQVSVGDGNKPPREVLLKDALKAFRSYSHLAHNFGRAELGVIEIFDLNVLDDPGYWHDFIADPFNYADRLLEKVRWVQAKLAKLSQLIEPEAPRVIEHTKRSRPEMPDLAILSTIVIEEDGRLSTPERLMQALASISRLYHCTATVYGFSPSTISVIGCDSGSDKALDFLGLASVVAGVREIIVTVWDRVVFNRQRKILVWVDLVSHSLPILTKIQDMQEKGSLSLEQAEILRRQILESVVGLVDAGVVAKEMPIREDQSLRRLLAPEPKLLTEASLVPQNLDVDEQGTPEAGGC